MTDANAVLGNLGAELGENPLCGLLQEQRKGNEKDYAECFAREWNRQAAALADLLSKAQIIEDEGVTLSEISETLKTSKARDEQILNLAIHFDLSLAN